MIFPVSEKQFFEADAVDSIPINAVVRFINAKGDTI
jgi:hypothetical protein